MVTVGSRVDIQCNFGFTLQGSRTVTCQSSGQWSPAIPVCASKYSMVMINPIKRSVHLIGNSSTTVYGDHKSRSAKVSIVLLSVNCINLICFLLLFENNICDLKLVVSKCQLFW